MPFLKDHVFKIEAGITLTELEEVLPSSETTSHYWHDKPQLERLRNGDAVIVVAQHIHATRILQQRLGSRRR